MRKDYPTSGNCPGKYTPCSYVKKELFCRKWRKRLKLKYLFWAKDLPDYELSVSTPKILVLSLEAASTRPTVQGPRLPTEPPPPGRAGEDGPVECHVRGELWRTGLSRLLRCVFLSVSPPRLGSAAQPFPEYEDGILVFQSPRIKTLRPMTTGILVSSYQIPCLSQGAIFMDCWSFLGKNEIVILP